MKSKIRYDFHGVYNRWGLSAWINRFGEKLPDPEIHVELPCGFKVEFFLTGLSDAEYVKRAKAIKKLEENERRDNK